MDIKIYKCFIASPSDTSSEREICDKVVTEINRGIGNSFNFRVELLKWETDTRPAFGESSQGVINEQIGTYDIFIGIMYKKFGTPTKHAGSGTEEEFDVAYSKLQKKEPVEIMFYFNNQAPNKLSDIIPEEWVKVTSFRKKIESLNGYYFMYDAASDFEDKLRGHLTQYFLKKHGDKSIYQDNTESHKERLSKIFQDRLNKALSTFSDQPIIWLEPILSNSNEISTNPDENYAKRINIEELISTSQSVIIKSPPQFGLTCLSHYMVKKAWEKDALWIYIDSETTKPHKIEKHVAQEAANLGFNVSDIKCIILDSWNTYEQDSFKKLKSLCDAYKDIPICVMHTIDDTNFFTKGTEEKINREFEVLHLLALPQGQIRKAVSEYNKEKDLGEEDVVLSKVVSDLEVLNIHRTPMNCFTLLKASEKNFDESPANRTNLLEKVLFVLFNDKNIPTYTTKPDLKDCEYVLGCFCENMIRNDSYNFTKDFFINELKRICSEKLLDIEVEILFDIFTYNSVIVFKECNYAFRASYWIFYFAAKRMHSDKIFAEYIFSSKKYISFPEIIEFYTGIDRNRGDALEILSRDIEEIRNTVHSKVRLPEGMNPYNLIQWHPTEEQICRAQEQISENVQLSGLPEAIKDQHADKSYNQIRPYNQSIQTFFEEYSLHNLMQNIRASSRALRNSDYVDPHVKREILIKILNGWEEISKVLFALTPILASKGEASFQGETFILADNFGETFEERMNMIIQVNPTNVVGFFKNDISSNKIGPLLYDQFSKENNKLIKHQLALLIVFTRPRGWKKHIENYIVSLSKNSFYLYDISNNLNARRQFDFLNDEELRNIEYLLKLGFAKHEYGGGKPLHQISKISLPKRENLNSL